MVDVTGLTPFHLHLLVQKVNLYFTVIPTVYKLGLCLRKKAAYLAADEDAKPASSLREFPGAPASGDGDIRVKPKTESTRRKPKSPYNSNMSLVHHVQDKDDFDNQLKEAGSKLVVVDFYATWCGPCKMISPKLDEMAQQMMADVVFLKVDVDECEEVASEYGISCMPTFILLKQCLKVEEFSGANADKLKELILNNK